MKYAREEEYTLEVDEERAQAAILCNQPTIITLCSQATKTKRRHPGVILKVKTLEKWFVRNSPSVPMHLVFHVFVMLLPTGK